MRLLQKSCCGCCTVKTGSLVICYMTLIQSVVPILNILSHTSPEAGGDRDTGNEYKRNTIWLGVVTIVVVGHALYGIYKKKPGYMVPFLIYQLIILFVLTMVLGFAPTIVEDLKDVMSSEKSQDRLPCFIASILFLIGTEAYFLLILFSHYLNLRQDAMAAANIPAVGFSAAVHETEGAAPYPNAYGAELPAKHPPPPYAV